VPNLVIGGFALLGVTATFIGFWVLGRLFLERHSPEGALVGWGIVYLLSICAAAFGLTNLKFVLAAFGILVVLSVLRRRSELLPTPGNMTPLLLMTPLFALALIMPPLYVDSYLHWLPNAAYLFRFDMFPASFFPTFLSLHPTYPTAMPVVIYVASSLAGRFVETAGNAANVVLSIIAIGAVATFISNDPRTQGSSRTAQVVAFFAVVPLNPSFQVAHYWSAIVDPALAITVLVLILKWGSLMSSSGDTKSSFFQDFATIFVLGALLAGLKNSGWVLASVLAIAAMIVGALERIQFRKTAAWSLSLVAGAVASTRLWTVYVAGTSFGPDQFSILPLRQWHFELLRPFARAVLRDFAEHYVYYLFVFGVVSVGAVALLKPRLIPDRNHRLVLGFASVAMMGHLSSLFLAYFGTGFYESEIARAASLQRYSSQVGFACSVVGIALLALAVWPYARRNKHAKTLSAGLYAVTVALFVIFPALRQRHYFFSNLGHKRDIAAQALAALPANEHVAVLGDTWPIRFLTYLVWINADASTPTIVDVEMTNYRSDWSQVRERYESWMTDRNIDDVLLLEEQDFMSDLGIGTHSDALWNRQTGWRMLDLNNSQYRPRDGTE
jgi:hypothetical protein